MGFVSDIFGKGSAPAMPAPSVPPPAPTPEDPAVQKAADEEAKRLARARGRASTILNSAIDETINPTAGQKTLGA